MEKNKIQFILGKSRTKVGRSQEYMANELGVARKTIQNWENGMSCPTVEQAMTWFEILNLNPLPYFIEYIHPSLEDIKPTDDDERIIEALHVVLNDLPISSIRQLFFLLYGNHGSSPTAILNMLTAHLQSPMKDRLINASIIEKNYEIAMLQHKTSCPTHVQPDLELLKQGIHEGNKAVLNGSESYMFKAVREDDETNPNEFHP